MIRDLRPNQSGRLRTKPLTRLIATIVGQIFMTQDELLELLRLKGKFLYHKESQRLEFKEQFNLASLADYFRDFAALANNKGGCLVFGVQDSPRLPVGLTDKSLDAFNGIDPERITGFLLEIFSSSISWEQHAVEAHGKIFGIFEVQEAITKPVIARKNEGKGNTIVNGDIYYRYGGRTQKILSAELEHILARRIEANNRSWMERVKQIGATGPEQALVVGTTDMLSDKLDQDTLMIDRELAEKLKFIREGEFTRKDGAAALRLVGDVQPVDQIEVTKVVKENLTAAYPLSATELAEEIEKQLPNTRRNDVWKAIAENDIKGDPDYSAFNFRNKKQEDRYQETGLRPKSIPCIYNGAAVDFLAKILRG